MRLDSDRHFSMVSRRKHMYMSHPASGDKRALRALFHAGGRAHLTRSHLVPDHRANEQEGRRVLMEYTVANPAQLRWCLARCDGL